MLTEILPVIGAREIEEVETKRRYMDGGNNDREYLGRRRRGG